MHIQCFMVEKTGLVDIRLRRYVSTPEMTSCSVHPWGYHNAIATVAVGVPAQLDADGIYLWIDTPKDDPSWPKACVCGYEFRADDNWQTMQVEQFRRVDSGEVLEGPDHNLPAGALWYANDKWPFYYPNPQDGKVLACKTPGGVWIIDGRANNGPKDAAGWSRTGEPPNVTVTPSIQAGWYHGWLRNGELVEC